MSLNFDFWSPPYDYHPPLGGAHVGDGKGSFNCDGEDGGGDNEDWEG